MLSPPDEASACSGAYRLLNDQNFEWAQTRSLYKHISSERYIFYHVKQGFTRQWVCGKGDGAVLIESKY